MGRPRTSTQSCRLSTATVQIAVILTVTCTPYYILEKWESLLCFFSPPGQREEEDSLSSCPERMHEHQSSQVDI